MTKPNGNPPGRPKGAKNVRTKAVEAAVQVAAAVLAEVIPDAFEGDAHAFLMAVYKDPRNPIDLRLDAAGKAIRFEKPALAAVDHTTLGGKVTFSVSAVPLSAEEWLDKHSKH